MHLGLWSTLNFCVWCKVWILVFVYGVRYGLKVILLHVNIQFFQNCLLKRLFFLHLIILKLFYKSVQFCFEFYSVYPHVSSICSYIRMTEFDY